MFEALERGLIDAGRARRSWWAPVSWPQRPGCGWRGRRWSTPTHTRGQVRAWLARRIARIDPEAADRKHRARVKKRCVRLWADPDGMATISAYLSAGGGPGGVGVVAGAAAGIDAPWDVANADAFVGLMTGTVVGTLIPVTVLQTSAGEELAGYGPISPGHAAKLRCVDSTLIDLTVVPEPSGGYRPAPRVGQWVRAHRIGIAGSRCRRPVQCDWTMWSRFRPGYVWGQFGAVVPVSPPVEDACELAGSGFGRWASALDQPAGRTRHLPATHRNRPAMPGHCAT